MENPIYKWMMTRGTHVSGNIHFNGIFPNNPSSYWGPPMYGKPHIVKSWSIPQTFFSPLGASELMIFRWSPCLGGTSKTTGYPNLKSMGKHESQHQRQHASGACEVIDIIDPSRTSFSLLQMLLGRADGSSKLDQDWTFWNGKQMLKNVC